MLWRKVADGGPESVHLQNEVKNRVASHRKVNIHLGARPPEHESEITGQRIWRLAHHSFEAL